MRGAAEVGRAILERLGYEVAGVKWNRVVLRDGTRVQVFMNLRDRNYVLISPHYKDRLGESLVLLIYSAAGGYNFYLLRGEELVKAWYGSHLYVTEELLGRLMSAGVIRPIRVGKHRARTGRARGVIKAIVGSAVLIAVESGVTTLREGMRVEVLEA